MYINILTVHVYAVFVLYDTPRSFLFLERPSFPTSLCARIDLLRAAEDFLSYDMNVLDDTTQLHDRRRFRSIKTVYDVNTISASCLFDYSHSRDY